MSNTATEVVATTAYGGNEKKRKAGDIEPVEVVGPYGLITSTAHGCAPDVGRLAAPFRDTFRAHSFQLTIPWYTLSPLLSPPLEAGMACLVLPACFLRRAARAGAMAASASLAIAAALRRAVTGHGARGADR